MPTDSSSTDEQLDRTFWLGRVIEQRYRLNDVIGQGGMGLVFRGEHLHTGRPVAVKVLLPNVTTSVAMLKRFQQEAKAASLLTHPNIVSILDFGTDHSFNGAYLVMEYLDGTSLDLVIEQSGPMDLARFYKIFRPACRALGYAHKNGIVHRDIKPSNVVLVNRADEEDVPVIVDFGLVKLMSAEPGELKLTSTNALMGSPLFMSPEQCRGLPIDGRSDIYSLGCVMYMCLTGFSPIIGDSALDTIYKHISEEPRPFKQVNPSLSLPPVLEYVVMRALAKNPDQRQQTMSQLAEELAEALNVVPTSSESRISSSQLRTLSSAPDSTNATECGARQDILATGANADHSVSGSELGAKLSRASNPSFIRTTADGRSSVSSIRAYVPDKPQSRKGRQYALMGLTGVIALSGFVAIAFLLGAGTLHLGKSKDIPNAGQSSRTTPDTESAPPVKTVKTQAAAVVTVKPAKPPVVRDVSSRAASPTAGAAKHADTAKLIAMAQKDQIEGDDAFDQQRWNRAEEHYRKCLYVRDRLPDGYDTASLNMLSKMVIASFNNRDDAALKEALRRFGESYAEDPSGLPQEVDILSTLAGIFGQRSRDYKLNAILQKNAIDVLDKIPGKERDLCRMMIYLAQTKEEQGDYGAAENWYHTAERRAVDRDTKREVLAYYRMFIQRHPRTEIWPGAETERLRVLKKGSFSADGQRLKFLQRLARERERR